MWSIQLAVALSASATRSLIWPLDRIGFCHRFRLISCLLPLDPDFLEAFLLFAFWAWPISSNLPGSSLSSFLLSPQYHDLEF